MKKTISVLLCACLLAVLLPSLPAQAGAAMRAPASVADGFNEALDRAEDLLFRLSETLRSFLRGLDVTGRLFGEDEAVPFPKAKVRAEKLLLLPRPEGDAALALGSLQGVLANVSGTQLLFRDGAYGAYLECADVRIEERAGESASPGALLKEFAPFVNGYVLCDGAGAQAAVSVAGVLHAAVIPESLREAAEAAGLPLLEDARGWTDGTLRRSRYFGMLSRTVAFSQPVSLAPKLVDYAVMCGGYFGFSDSDSRWDCRKTYAFLRDNAVVFGWNPVLGEYGTVAALSSLNACLIPADHACNLSVLSGFPSAGLKQTVREEEAGTEPGHTVCLFMSDGDNLQWMLTAFTDGAHFGSPLRGRFPMGWGVPASLNTAAPAMAEWLYRNASENDEFLLQLSGLGYTFPSKWSNPFALRRMDRALSEEMERSDLRIAAVLDDGGFSCRSLDVLAANRGVSAVFYLDFADYAGLNGAARLSHGKPVVSARYKLWQGAPGGSPEEIAAAVNAAPKDPADPDAYSLIVVHAWSGLDGGGNFTGYGDTMAAVERMVAAFDGDVRVVTPSVFASALADAIS